MASWSQSKGQLKTSDQFHRKWKAIMFNETSITAQPFHLEKSTEKSSQTLSCLSWPDISAIYVRLCFWMVRCEILGFSLSLLAQPFLLTTNKPFYHCPLIICNFFEAKFPIFTGVNRFVYVHFLCFLYCLHFKAKCLPRKGLAWIKFFENWPHKKKHFLIGCLGHHTAGQKTGWSNIVRCRREKSISRLTT